MTEAVGSGAPVAAVVLAAGEGKRMHSSRAKVLHEMAGRSMLAHVLDRLDELGIEERVIIVGHGRDEVIELCKERGAAYAVQEEQLGTAHAFQQALPALRSFRGTVLVLCGDMPLLTGGTLRRLLATHLETGAVATVLSADLEDPTGYGRVLRDQSGGITRIVEHREASDEERRVCEINTAIYSLAHPEAAELLEHIDSDNRQGEFYLTDLVALLREQGRPVAVVKVEDPREALGVNTVEQLSEAAEAYRELVRSGRIPGPETSGSD
jgi:bifunctional UDP-N-acetylglucosamine pyrophosphorylase/glucosamine-1-phosphate N-acetyltransferase